MAKFKFLVEEIYTVVYEIEAATEDDAYAKLDKAVTEGVCSPVKDGVDLGRYDRFIHGSASEYTGPCVNFEEAIQNN